MREKYDIANLNLRKNPYAKTDKKQAAIHLDENSKATMHFEDDRFVIPEKYLKMSPEELELEKRETACSDSERTPKAARHQEN